MKSSELQNFFHLTLVVYVILSNKIRVFNLNILPLIVATELYIHWPG